jgi:hypothetical protein
MGNITKTRKYFDRCNYTELNEDIAKTDWVHLLAEENDIDTNWCKFHGIIMKIEDKHIPTKTIKLSSKGKRVFPVNTKILEKIKKKHSLSKKANIAGDPETRKQYNKIRRILSIINVLGKRGNV